MPPLGADVAVPEQVFVKQVILCVVTFVEIGKVGCVTVTIELVTQVLGVDTSWTVTVYTPAHKPEALLRFDTTVPLPVVHVKLTAAVGPVTATVAEPLHWALQVMLLTAGTMVIEFGWVMLNV